MEHSIHTSIRALMVAGALCAPAAASAQVDLSGEISVQQFNPLPGGDNNYLSVGGASVLPHTKVSGGAYFNYANDPLVLGIRDSDRSVALLRHHVQMDALLAVGLFDAFELGLRAPVTLFQSSEEDPSLPSVDVAALTVGDLTVVPKWQILGQPRGASFALVMPVTFPTSPDGNLQGNASLTAEPRGIVEYKHGNGIRASANLGYLIRPRQTFANVDVGNELTYGAAYQHPILPERLYALAEVFGKVGLDPGNDELIPEEAPLEVDLAARYMATREHAITAGAGFGITPGLGTPAFRILAVYTFSQNPPPDIDGDGITNAFDACIDVPEDLDSFEDEDGCPEYDNDNDGILDVDDSCPLEPEDFDNLADEDGCPEDDADSDSIVDADDSCPLDPEDIDAFEDADGCPDPDNDADGIADADDRCPLEKEDVDEFQDDDGCPDLDNDSDGIADLQDQCPDEREIYNGVKDDDGCPDKGRSKVKLESERITILDKVYFDRGKATIKARSFPLLDQVAGVLRSNPQITLVEIGGHTDDRGSDTMNLELSLDRARSVRDYLIDKGVDSGRLTAAGYGETRMMCVIKEVRGKTRKRCRDASRRVEFVIKEQNGASNVRTE